MALAVRKPVERVRLERPFQQQHEGSLRVAMQRATPPKGLGGLLSWYSRAWDGEVPMSLHRVEDVWRDYGLHAEGGSKLGTPAHKDPFRRYMENPPSETDEDGSFVRPLHAALDRMSRRWPLTARALFAVAQSGYDWRGVAGRLGYADEFFCLYLERALTMLWVEYRERA